MKKQVTKLRSLFACSSTREERCGPELYSELSIRNGEGDDHGIDKKVVIEEAERAGFILVNAYDFVKPDNVDYFLVFRPQ